MLGIAIPSVTAQTLKVGDSAPKIEVKSFVKGEPVKEFEAGKTYVVEFWATWCGPCKVSIPHLTEMQKKYPAVPFIGVSVWENDQGLVKPFVDEMGDKMALPRRHGCAFPKGAAGREAPWPSRGCRPPTRTGIPSAFIVSGESKIYWIGHPMQMDEPLAKDRLRLVGPENRDRRVQACPRGSRERQQRPKVRKLQTDFQQGNAIG